MGRFQKFKERYERADNLYGFITSEIVWGLLRPYVVAWVLAPLIAAFWWLLSEVKWLTAQGWATIALLAIILSVLSLFFVCAALAFWRLFNPLQQSDIVANSNSTDKSIESAILSGNAFDEIRQEIRSIKSEIQELEETSGASKGRLSSFNAGVVSRLTTLSARFDQHILEEKCNKLASLEKVLDMKTKDQSPDWGKWKNAHEVWSRTAFQIGYLAKPYYNFDYFSTGVSLDDIMAERIVEDFDESLSQESILKWKEYSIRKRKVWEGIKLIKGSIADVIQKHRSISQIT